MVQYMLMISKSDSQWEMNIWLHIHFPETDNYPKNAKTQIFNNRWTTSENADYLRKNVE